VNVYVGRELRPGGGNLLRAIEHEVTDSFAKSDLKLLCEIQCKYTESFVRCAQNNRDGKVVVVFECAWHYSFSGCADLFRL